MMLGRRGSSNSSRTGFFTFDVPVVLAMLLTLAILDDR